MLNKDTLLIWKEECGDEKIVMLIEQLIATYAQLDSERAQKEAVIRSAATITKGYKEQATIIDNLIHAASNQDLSISAAVASFRKIYEISVYGNEIFKNERFLRLWPAVERLIGSKNQNEMAINMIEVSSLVQSLNDDAMLVDMRNNLLSYTDFINVENENRERERNSTEDNDSLIERSDDSGAEA